MDGIAGEQKDNSEPALHEVSGAGHPILMSRDSGLLTIRINIPDRRNALNTEVALQLLEAVQSARDDSDVRAVLLMGAGDTFCVGGDVKGMASPTKKPASFEAKFASMQRTMEITRILHEMAKPVVVAVRGAAAGAGFALALSADFRVVGENAKLTTAFSKLGLSGDYGCLYYLTKAIGGAKARELAMLSPVLSGNEAYALGLVTRVVRDEDVNQAALELAMSLAEGPTVALGYIKKNINNAGDLSLSKYLESEAMHHGRCLQTEDYNEAATAFVQKRRPNFKGQ